MHLDNVLDFEVTDPALAASAPPPSGWVAAHSRGVSDSSGGGGSGDWTGSGFSRATRKTSAQTSTPTIPSTNAGYKTAWRARDFAPRRRSSWSSAI